MSLVHLFLLQERLSDLPPLVLPPCPAGLHSHNHVKSVPKLWDQRCGWGWQGGGIYILDLFIQSLHVLVTLWCSIWFKQPNVKSAMCMFFSFWPSQLYLVFSTRCTWPNGSHSLFPATAWRTRTPGRSWSRWFSGELEVIIRNHSKYLRTIKYWFLNLFK